MISITTQSQTIIPHYYQTWKNIKTTATFVGKDLHGGVLDNETVWHQKLCHRNFKLTFGADYTLSVLGMWKYISSKQVYLLSITHNNQQTKHGNYVFLQVHLQISKKLQKSTIITFTNQLKNTHQLSAVIQTKATGRREVGLTTSSSLQFPALLDTS